ncbi:MAG TPA: SPFH domain-containing protein [Kofleriaceae bacterium]|nr:SPFH domain-containing protein [Kofleriaceae bacterium]
MLFLGILVGAAAYCVYLLARCFFRVEQGNLAVLTSFGAAQKDGKQLITYGPGIHFKWPWQRVHHVAMMEQSLELSGESGRTAMTYDGTILRFDSILRFQPVPAELEHFLFELKSPHEHITGLFTSLLRNEIANFHPPAHASGDAKSNVDSLQESIQATGGAYAQIRRERALLNQRIEEFCRTQIGRRYGVQFNAVDLTDILPPDELANALNAVINAQTEAESLYSHAEADTRQQVVAAEHGVEIAKARGLATELEINTLGDVLTRLHAEGTLADYVGRRRAEVVSQSKTLYVRSNS